MRDSRKLIVMRHAKAGELPGGPDFERALRPRGRRDSEAAGRWLAGHEFRPDAVICSAARRTRQTWHYLSAKLGGDAAFSADQRLYGADSEDVADDRRRDRRSSSRRVGCTSGTTRPRPRWSSCSPGPSRRSRRRRSRSSACQRAGQAWRRGTASWSRPGRLATRRPLASPAARGGRSGSPPATDPRRRPPRRHRG